LTKLLSESGEVDTVKLICALALVLAFGSAAAKDYCPRMPEPKKEGDVWYMPESSFTKEAANKALKELSDRLLGFASATTAIRP
jgi:hypothetical protein